MANVIGLDFGNWNAFPAFIENMNQQTRMGGTIHDLIPDRYRQFHEAGIPNEFFWGRVRGENGMQEKELFGFAAIDENLRPRENHLRLLKRNIKNMVTLYAEAGKKGASKTFQYKNLIVKAVSNIVKIANDALRESYGEAGTTHLVSMTYPAVLSDPSSLRYFIDLVEQADSGVRDANGKMLKVKVVGAISEPAAAGLDQLNEQRGQTLRETETRGVIDFGGGTYDLAIVSLYPRGRQYANGETYYFDPVVEAEGLNIGGSDFSLLLENLFNEKLKREIGREPSSVHKNVTKKNVEDRKQKLSMPDIQTVTITYDVDDDPVDIDVTRHEFNQIIAPKVAEVVKYTRKFFNDNRNHLPDSIIMTGGSSYIPYVQEQLIAALPEFQNKITTHRPSKAAAYGAARFFNPVPGHVNPVRRTVTHDLGTLIVGTDGSREIETLITRGTEIPCSSREHSFVNRRPGSTSTDYDVYQANKEKPAKARVSEDYNVIHNAALRNPNVGADELMYSRCTLTIDELGTLHLSAWDQNNRNIRIEEDFKLNGN